MPVCQFFLQGRCRYGEKCWNEHPRGGRGGGGGFNNRAPPQQQQQQPRGGGGGGGGGFGNRVWVNPSQQRGGYVQPSSFGSRDNDQWNRRGDSGGSDWGGGRGGGNFGRRENIKSSDFSFSQNRFSSLDTPSSFNKGGRAAQTADDDNDRKCEIIQSDMEIWDSSGQWGFSTYSSAKNPLSGFTDLSPEELRFEYYTSRASGNLQSYLNGVNQLLSQWRNRVQELKIMSASTRAALLRELNNDAPQGSSAGFGSTDTGSSSGFGSKGFGGSEQLSSFSFAAPASGFGSASAPPPTGFGSAPSAPPPSGFGSSPAPSASTFSFATQDKTPAAAAAAPAAQAPSGFGAASGFSFSSASGGGFGTGFGTQTPVTSGATSVFGQPSTSVSAPAVSTSGELDCLFSTEATLTAEELNQFKAKRFTLGQIPLKPPPANLLAL